MSDRERDPYQELGIGRDATAADIARAWRRLARAVHPDSRPGDPAAAAQFRALADAYGLLSDPARRAAWDHQHPRPARRPRPAGPAGPYLWPLPAAARPWLADGPVPGPALWAGPVHIHPPKPPVSGQFDLAGADPALARVLWWLLADWQERPW
jgi:curved DNA-binding protein CbpA